MDDRVIQFRVGVLAVTTVLITTLLLFFFGELQPLVGATYVVHVRFTEAPRVMKGTPVRKNGIRIGKVHRVKLEDDGVLVSISVQSDFELYDNEICKINTGNLFGDAVLEFVRVDDMAAKQSVTDGEYLDGEVGKDPLNVLFELQDVISGVQGEVEVALESVSTASREIGTLARTFNQFVHNHGDQVTRILARSEGALESISRAAVAFDQLVGDEKVQGDLKRTIEQIPDLLRQASQTLSGLQRLSETAQQSMTDLNRFTRPLGERGPQIVAGIDSTVETLDSMLGEIRKFSEALNNSDGSFNQLLNDRELYDRVTRAAGNIEEVSRQIQPILNDVRVFTDKIARNPSQLGVAGALQGRQSGLKWSPWRRQADLRGR